MKTVRFSNYKIDYVENVEVTELDSLALSYYDSWFVMLPDGQFVRHTPNGIKEMVRWLISEKPEGWYVERSEMLGLVHGFVYPPGAWEPPVDIRRYWYTCDVRNMYEDALTEQQVVLDKAMDVAKRAGHANSVYPGLRVGFHRQCKIINFCQDLLLVDE